MLNFDKTYRLEFHEAQQNFHLELLEKPYVHEEGTHGWVTIGEGKDSLLCAFIDYIDERYNPHCAKKEKVKMSTIKREWKWYLVILNKHKARTDVVERLSNPVKKEN